MSFLNRLFKSKAPETLEQKIANINTYDQMQLLACVSSDQPETFICAVITHLNYSPTLLDLATNHASTQQVKNTARRRIGELLDTHSLAVSVLTNDLKDRSLLLQLCSYSVQASLSLVADITDPALLLTTAQTGATTQIRQAAATKITDRSDLEQLAKQAKLKDKSVYKIVRTKLDVFKEQKAEEKEIADQVNAICGQAEQLTKRNIDDIFHARKLQIEKVWSEFADRASESARKRFNDALNICEQKLESIRIQLNAEVERKAAILHAKKDVLDAIDSLQGIISNLFTLPTDVQLITQIEQSNIRQEKAINEAIEQGMDVSAEKRKADYLNTAIHSLLHNINTFGPLTTLIGDLKNASQDVGEEIKNRIQKILAYSKNLADHQIPPIIEQAKQSIDDWTQRIKEQSEVLKSQQRDTADLIRKGEWAVTNGHVGRARAILRDLEAATLAHGELPNHLSAKIHDFKTAVHKLGDWHEFAVTPKKEALVKQMEELIGSDSPPQPLADKIQKLQDQWKELCKGGQNQDDTSWQEFHAAAQKAYEPCKVYFEKQSQERVHNAQQRKTLLTQLHEYLNAYDWNAADWKAVEKTLRISRDAWQSYWPVPRKDTKELQAEFDQVMDQLYGKLNAAQEHNKNLKQAIVDQAEKLITQSDTHSAIESAKSLQAQWQRIGLCKRKEDQALWKLFRIHCDAVFEKRSQENDALREEREQAKIKALGLLDQIQQLFDLNGEAFFAARTEIEQLCSEFKAIGEFPKNDSKELFDRYNKINDGLQTKTQTERLTVNQQQWCAAFAIADQIRKLELAHPNSNADITDTTAIQQLVKNVNKWPGNVGEIINARIENLPNITPKILDEAEEKLRLLCIRSEIINGKETNEHDKSLRMRHQVEQMKNDGLGKASTSTKQGMYPLLEAWLAQPGCGDPTYSELLERFSRCWNVKLY